MGLQCYNLFVHDPPTNPNPPANHQQNQPTSKKPTSDARHPAHRRTQSEETEEPDSGAAHAKMIHIIPHLCDGAVQWCPSPQPSASSHPVISASSSPLSTHPRDTSPSQATVTSHTGTNHTYWPVSRPTFGDSPQAGSTRQICSVCNQLEQGGIGAGRQI